MLKIRNKGGELEITSLNGKKLVVKKAGKGYTFNSQWWPEEEAHSMLYAIDQAMNIDEPN